VQVGIQVIPNTRKNIPVYMILLLTQVSTQEDALEAVVDQYRVVPEELEK
jgi:hypothetical protein